MTRVPGAAPYAAAFLMRETSRMAMAKRRAVAHFSGLALGWEILASASCLVAACIRAAVFSML